MEKGHWQYTTLSEKLIHLSFVMTKTFLGLKFPQIGMHQKK